MGPARTSIIVNPAAGRGRARSVAADLQQRLALLGVAADLVQPMPGHTRDVVRQRVAGGDATVIACGGDGTVHEVMQGVLGSQAAFAIAPCGTGNDIASVLGMRDADLLARSIAACRTRPVDVGWVGWSQGEDHFLGVLSTGFDSTVNERANGMRFPTGRARYLASVVAELRGYRARHYTVEVDGHTLTGHALLVCVANGGTYGGGMRVCPDARVDDGALDITWVEDIPRTEFIRVLPRVFSGAHVSHPAVHTYRCSSVTVQADDQVAYADGERLGALPIRVAARPGALRVVDTAVA
jgi:diacylglycerol kinase (ATP)